MAEAADGAEAVALVGEGVDLAILDIAMPRTTGLQAAREISARVPDVRILVLSMYDNEQYLFEALKAGASGSSAPRRSTATGRTSWPSWGCATGWR